MTGVVRTIFLLNFFWFDGVFSQVIIFMVGQYKMPVGLRNRQLRGKVMTIEEDHDKLELYQTATNKECIAGTCVDMSGILFFSSSPFTSHACLLVRFSPLYFAFLDFEKLRGFKL
jgi:hypothetical protein